MASSVRSSRYRSWNVGHDDGGDTRLLESPAPVTTITPTKSKKSFSFWSIFLVMLIAGVLFFVGFFLGYFLRESFEERLNVTARYRHNLFDKEKLESIHENIMYFLSRDPDNIKKFIREFGAADPLTNSIREKKLEHTVYQQLLDYNFDSVDVDEYSVVVTYPNPNQPNQLEVVNKSGKLLANFTLKNSETEEDNFGPIIKTLGIDRHYAKYPYVAFSSAGTAEGGLLYGHYGRQSDLLELKHHGINIKRHLLLLRLGEISVSQKVAIATQAGASGVLLYWDPVDGSTEMPHNSSQIPYASARPENGNDLHKIPVQTVSARIASWLFENMEGDTAPQPWVGGLNVIYVLGVPNNKTKTFKLTSYNQQKDQVIRNVIGSIHGYTEPEHYVMIGAPRSGFPGTSSDAVLGTAMLLQLARSLEYVQTLEKWKPQRGIKLVSWGGHEFSQAGKTEYIKANSHLLERRAISYFDLSQMTVGNHSVTAVTSPAFYNLIREAAAKVPDPTKTEETVAGSWSSLSNIKKKSPINTFQQDVEQNPFLHTLGVPEIKIQYSGPHKATGSSVMYMASLDAHHHFKYHIAITRVITLAALQLVDAIVLPISVSDYADDISLVMWQTSGELKHCSTHMEDLDVEVAAAKDLMRTATAFRDFLTIYKKNAEPLGIHSSNEAKIMFERIFISSSDHKRQHLLYPQLFDGSVKRLTELCKISKFTNNWDTVHSYITSLRTALKEATRCLRINE